MGVCASWKVSVGMQGHSLLNQLTPPHRSYDSRLSLLSSMKGQCSLVFPLCVLYTRQIDGIVLKLFTQRWTMGTHRRRERRVEGGRD